MAFTVFYQIKIEFVIIYCGCVITNNSFQSTVICFIASQSEDLHFPNGMYIYLILIRTKYLVSKAKALIKPNDL